MNYSCCIKKPAACMGENKGQIICAVTAQLISVFVFATQIVQSPPRPFLNPNFKLLACFCGCAGWFVSDLAGNSNCLVFFSFKGS